MAQLLEGYGWTAKLERAGLRWRSMEPEPPKSIYLRFNENAGTSRRSSSGSSSSNSSSGGSSISFEESEFSHWYVIPAKDLFYSYNPATETELTLSPARIPTLLGLDDCTSVFLFPRIYIIGGTPTPYDTSVPSPVPFFTPTGRRSVYSYDITASPLDGNWQEIEPMEAARSSPCVFVVDEKIFVFGGLYCSCCSAMENDGCYATKPLLEIYNPKTETWEGRLHGGYIRFMAQGVKRLSPLFLDRKGHRHILLHTDLSLLTYDIDSDSVITHCHGPTFKAAPFVTNAVVDGILFCHYPDFGITGFDMTSPHLPGMRLSGLTCGKELPDLDEDFVYANLLSIGASRMAILWSSRSFDFDGSLLYCSVVKVDKTYRNGKHGLHAVVETFNTYFYYGGSGETEIDCLAF